MPANTNPILRFFGAGGAFSRRYGTTCSVLALPSGAKWLIDCGRQAPDQLHAAGLDWHDFEGPIVTHVHGDHAFGLEDLALRRFHEQLGGLEPINRGGPRPKLIAHSAVVVEIREMLGPALRYLPPPYEPTAGTLEHYFELVPAASVEAPRAGPWNHAEAFTCGELTMVARETQHVPQKPSTSIELALGATGTMAYWSADATVDVEFLRSIEPRTSVYFHDCTFIEYPGQVHGSFTVLASLPEAIRRKMVLMHYEDDIEDHRTRAQACGFRIAEPGHAFDLETGKRIE